MTIQHLAWLLIVLGLGVVAWAGYDSAMGETRVESTSRWLGEPVQQDEEPARFRQLIIINVIGGVTCLAIGGWLLITGA